jgi:epoxyqueuosine reductase
MGNRIYGCDDCLAICPWNKFAQRTDEDAFKGRLELTAPRLRDLAELDDAGFRQVFTASPIKRTGRARFVRNVLIAIGNSGLDELTATARGLLDDESELVRAAAVWAFARLADLHELRREADRRMALETDPDVRAEWAAELPVA